MTISNLDNYPCPFVTPKALADYLLVSPRTIYAWIDKGALQAQKFEGTVRIPTEEAKRFVKVPIR